MHELYLKLEKLGLSPYEAKAYLALMQKSPANGYEISKISKIPTSKIYETLLKLKNKGFIYANDYLEPVRYYPAPPDDVLDALREEYNATIEQLGMALQRVKPLPNIDLAWNLTGAEAVLAKSKEIIANAAETLYLSLWPEDATQLRDVVNQAAARGVKIICGVFGESGGGGDFFNVATINLTQCGHSSQIRLGSRLTAISGDNREVLISETDGRETLGVWTLNPGIVLMAKEYIRHDIWGRILIDHIGEERFQRLSRENEFLNYLINNR